jgi:hypothetical protein
VSRHKHADLIIAWANGANIQLFSREGKWVDIDPAWSLNTTYRVKPEPVPDVQRYARVILRGASPDIAVSCKDNWNLTGKPSYTMDCNCVFTFDGETKQLKHVEIVK